ncbi:MAG: FkbM family methyltransferase [Armatimonadota bacterium]
MTQPRRPYEPVAVPPLAALAACWWRRGLRGASVVSRVCSRFLGSRQCQLRVGEHCLKIPFADPITYLYLANGVLNSRCVAALERILTPGSVVYDIGANYGLFGWQALRLVGPQGRVVFFEPNPGVAECLRANLAANQVHNALLVEKAVSECVGQVDLLVPPRRQSGLATIETGDEAAQSWRRCAVETTSVDCFRRDSGIAPTLLKLDVEGHELSVLRGAEETLGACHPVLMLEMEILAQDPTGEAATEILALLARHGYCYLYAVSHSALQRITQGQPLPPICDMIAATIDLEFDECAARAH